MEMLPSSASSTSSLWIQRFYANFPTLQEQQAEIHRLYEETLDQQRRLDELEAQQTQRASSLQSDEERRRKVHQLQRQLQDQDVQMLEAAQTIEMLMRDVQVARAVARQAEKAQREAEADQMLRHVLQESDGEGSDSVAVQTVRLEAESVTDSELQSESRAKEVEHEEKGVTDAGERLRPVLQALKVKDQQVGSQVYSEDEMVQQLEMIKTRAADEIKRYEAMDVVRQQLVTVLQAQVQAFRSDKESMDNAIVLCQRSVDKRFQVLEQDRLKIEAENCRLRHELSSVLQYLKSVDVKLHEVEEKDGKESLKAHERLDARLAQACAYQDQLARRVTNAEQTIVLITSTTGGKQPVKGQSQATDEKKALLLKLEEERRQSAELERSTRMLQESVDSALKELREVEIELRAINSDVSSGDEPHDTLAGLAKQVISDFKRYDQPRSSTVTWIGNVSRQCRSKQNDVCMEAFMASMQVQHLTSLMHAHLSRLRALRNQQEICSTSANTRYLPCSDSGEFADHGWDTLDGHQAAADIDVACSGTVKGEYE
uniref:Uncharacterized protein n=1 Tax=Hyaloperonospora arabidopsidis (strain Emoy2) TaxID=559515 RepID=M4B5W2_HYAAE